MSSGAALTAAHLERAAYVYIRQPCFELEEYAGASVHAMRPCRGASSELARNQAHFTRAAQRLCSVARAQHRILYVPGNHEFHGSEIDIARPELARQCLEHGVTLLDRRAVTVDEVRFIVATLWTDFALEGVVGQAWAHIEARQGLAGFTGAIRHHGGPEGRFAAREAA